MKTIKKQVGILAGSILLTSSVSGFSSLSDSSAVLVLSTADSGSYVYNTGLTTSQLINAPSFSISLSAASSALGGAIDSFALFGLLGGTINTYSYEAFSYIDVNGGVIYAQSIAGDIQPPNFLDGWRALTNSYIANVTAGGFHSDTSLGDLESTAFGRVFLGIGLLNNNGDIANLYKQWQSDEFDSSGKYIGQVTQQQLTSTAQIINGNFVFTSVPIPSAAWLFGSALLGLAGLAKRKKT